MNWKVLGLAGIVVLVLGMGTVASAGYYDAGEFFDDYFGEEDDLDRVNITFDTYEMGNKSGELVDFEGDTKLVLEGTHTAHSVAMPNMTDWDFMAISFGREETTFSNARVSIRDDAGHNFDFFIGVVPNMKFKPLGGGNAQWTYNAVNKQTEYAIVMNQTERANKSDRMTVEVFEKQSLAFGLYDQQFEKVFSFTTTEQETFGTDEFAPDNFLLKTPQNKVAYDDIIVQPD